MKENIIQTKTFSFAERIVKLYRFLISSLMIDCEAIQKILWSIQKTTKENTIGIRNS